ncbi:hypothetical protein [Aeromonas caviae]|uniref:hypothetical protein n=1 Tax=Aeromonas caviae TaxID=648 RepID=UPI002B4854BC|nr:hypothetical protein [Aeromonas caviae]
MKDPHFKMAYEHINKAVPAHHDTSQCESNRITYPVPDFHNQQWHPDPELDEIIRRTVEELREVRDAFLLVIHTQLNEDDILRFHFLKNIRKKNDVRYLTALNLSAARE